MSASTQVAALDPQSLQAQATILQKCTAAVARELSQLLAALKYLVKEGWKFKHIINLIAKHDDRIFNNQLFDHEVKYR